MRPRMYLGISRLLSFLWLLLLALLPSTDYPVVQATAARPLDIPTTLVPAGIIDYWLASPRVFFHTGIYCDPIVPGDSLPSQRFSPTAVQDEVVSRMSIYGGSLRPLFEYKVDGGIGECPPLRIRSNIVADANHVYWVEAAGLMRLSVDASIGASPTLLSKEVLPFAELVDGGDRIFALTGISGVRPSEIWSIDKTTGSVSLIDTPSAYGDDLAWDGEYLYYRYATYLRRLKPGDPTRYQFAGDFNSYYAEGLRSTWDIESPEVVYSQYVYVNKGNQIYRFNSLNNKTDGPIYTSTDADAYISSMTSDQHRLFFFEERPTCPSGACSVLLSIRRSGGTAKLLCHCKGMNLTTDHTFLFWNVIRYGSMELTYEGLYRLPNNGVAPIAVKKPFLHGDYLRAVGSIRTDPVRAALSDVSRLSTTPALSVPQQQGTYVLQLLDGQNTVLANHIFSPTLTAPDEPERLSFGLVVEFVPGTAQMQILRNADAAVLTSQTISPNPPLISNVTLSDTISLSGTVTLAWTASDPDNDPLHFTFAYRRVNDPDFQPLPLDLVGTLVSTGTVQFGVNAAPFESSYRVQIDTTQLGGGGAVFGVIASDGVQSAQADSDSVTLPYKPPQPQILTPEDNSHVPHGEAIHFSGLAEDFQDEGVTGEGLVWSNQNGETLGTGALLSLENLPVGSHQIMLAATNSVGLQASTTITVNVNTDPPTATATATLTNTPTGTPSSTPTPTATPTNTPTPTSLPNGAAERLFLPVVTR